MINLVEDDIMNSTFQKVTFYILSELFLTFWLGKSVCFVSWCKSSKHPLIREKEKIWIVNESQLESSVYLLIILLLRMFVLLLSCQLLLIVFFWICKMFCLCEYCCLKPMFQIVLMSFVLFTHDKVILYTKIANMFKEFWNDYNLKVSHNHGIP